MKRLIVIMLVIGIVLIGVVIKGNREVKEPIELTLIREKIEQLDQNYETITYADQGSASWYDYQLDSGWSSVGHYVCASRDFERYSMLRVVNMENGKVTGCLVTDYVENPDVIIDLSSTAFADLAPLSQGIIKEVSVSQIN